MTVGIGAPLLVDKKGTTWAFEHRGDAYVSVFMPLHQYDPLTYQGSIGNTANARAMQLEPNSQNIS